MPRAASLADEIKENFQVEAELIGGSGGCFDVHVDDQLVFSKHQVDRFPNDGEVVGLIKNQVANS